MLPTIQLDTSDDRPGASGDVVVQTLVRTSARVVARFRRWFRSPPELAHPLVTAPRDSLGFVTICKQHATVDVGHRIADF